LNDSPTPNLWSVKDRSKSRRTRGESQPEARDDNTVMAQWQTCLPPPDLFAAASHAGTCIHAINGEELVTDCEGVAYLPAEQALLVADLHLEKGSSLARRGQLLPPYDTMTTLKRLGTCLERWQPRKVIALGDSFHDDQASGRLPEDAFQLLEFFLKQREWVWISGNHDPLPPQRLGGQVIHSLSLGKLTLRHEPQVESPPGEIAGHLHPKARLVRRGRSIRRSCFAASRDRMIMPSFGAYTGGLSVFDPAFDGLFDGLNFHALMRGDGQVYRIAAVELR
jgi:DNA ligase-associated metallophosphoesterase